MDISKMKLTEKEKDILLAYEEDHFTDLKAKEITPKKLSKSVSAFANSSGGDLYIGISEIEHGITKIREWKGFKDIESANGHIQGLSTLFPLGDYYNYEFLETETEPGYVLKIHINKTRDVTLASDGIPYIRRGAQNLPQRDPKSIERLRLDKGIISFEQETVQVNLEFVCTSKVISEFIRQVVPTTRAEEWLKSQLLIINGHPTIAGVLLFSDNPQAILPKRCGIKILRYKTPGEGTRETLVDPITIEGDLYSQIKIAVQKTIEIVEQIKKLGPHGLESVIYPDETLHEILTNAVIHRDYSIQTDIQIRIFENRIEVESPGKLPGHVTVKNILKEQFARNGTIVRLINKFPDPPNKDVGEGLNTAFAAMKKLRLKEPIIEESENSVIVTIKHEPLATPEEEVLKFLEHNDEITNRIGRQINGIQSENTMKNVFYRLRERGIIEPIPGRRGKNSAWRLKK